MTIEKMSFELFMARMLELMKEEDFKIGANGEGNDTFIRGTYIKFYESYYKRLSNMDEYNNEKLSNLYKELQKTMRDLMETNERIPMTELFTQRVRLKVYDIAAEIFVLKIFVQKIKSLLTKRGLEN